MKKKEVVLAGVLKKTVTTKCGKVIDLDAENKNIPDAEWGNYSKYLGRQIIDIEDIYVDHKHQIITKADIGYTNSIRLGSKPDTSHCETQIMPVILKHGILYDKPLPAIYKLSKPIFANNRNYWYRMGNVGNHRIWSFDTLGIESWIFDIYEEIQDDWAKYDIGFDSNDTIGNVKPLDSKDMVAAFKEMLQKGRWGNPGDLHVDEVRKLITNYLDEHTTISKAKYKGIVAKTIRKTDVKTDHTEWLADQAEEFVVQVLGSTVKGQVDSKRGTHGWVIGPGKLKEKFTYAIEKISQTGKGSHGFVHVNQPLDGNSTMDARYAEYEKLQKLNKALDAAWAYKKRTGRYPLEYDSFLPQDELVPEDPSKSIPIKDVLKTRI
tara:strand:+ start:3546 stop:4679 length:1134 start_codon:yes stop_codon:yes gene_type:complete